MTSGRASGSHQTAPTAPAPLDTAMRCSSPKDTACRRRSVRAREFVRIALHAAAVWRGAGPIGQADVRLDVGPGSMHANEPGDDDRLPIMPIGRLLSNAGLGRSSIVRENAYARFETGGGATLSIQADPDETIAPTTAIYSNATTSTARSTGWPGSASRSSTVRATPWMGREARLRDPSGNTGFCIKAGEDPALSTWRMAEGNREYFLSIPSANPLRRISSSL